MDRATLVREVPHKSELSISDQARHGAMSRRDFPIPGGLVPETLGKVRLPGSAGIIPAVVASRSILTAQEVIGTNARIRDQWRFGVMPYEENILVRALARCGSIGPTDLPPARVMGEGWPAKSDITVAMRKAHQALSDLRPPYEGTMLLVVLWQDKLGVARFNFIVSSVNGVRRERLRALQNNRKAAASSWPLSSPMRLPMWLPGVGGWPIWGKGHMQYVPSIPKTDEWVQANRDKITEVVEEHFRPSLLSLWKAAFAEPPVAAELVNQGYLLGEQDRTMLGPDDLKELMRDRAQNPVNLTVLGTPEMLEELAAEFMEPID